MDEFCHADRIHVIVEQNTFVMCSNYNLRLLFFFPHLSVVESEEAMHRSYWKTSNNTTLACKLAFFSLTKFDVIA